MAIKNESSGFQGDINLALVLLVSLFAGIVILVMPRLLNSIVAIYLITIGLIGIFGIRHWRDNADGRCKPDD